jgi:hypothetical protein
MEVIPSTYCIFGPGVCDLKCFRIRGLSASWDRVVLLRGYFFVAIYMHSCGVCFFLGLLEYNCFFVFRTTVYVSAILRVC